MMYRNILIKYSFKMETISIPYLILEMICYVDWLIYILIF